MKKIQYKGASAYKLFVFAQVARFSSVSKAAEVLAMTQPAVTNVIRQLEQHFQTKLFELVAKQLRLTIAGSNLLHCWTELDISYRNLYAAMAADDQHNVGCLSIAMVSSAKYFMPRLMAQFKQQYPLVELQCKTMHRSRLIAAVCNYEVELGVLTDAPVNENTQSICLATNELVFIAHPQHPLAACNKVSVTQLRSENFIVREQEALISQRLFGLCASAKLQPNVVLTLDSTEAIKQAVAANCGIALVPAISIARECQYGDLVRLAVTRIQLSSQWTLLYAKPYARNHLLQSFMQYVAQHFK